MRMGGLEAQKKALPNIQKYTERMLLGDVFHAKNDAKTLCFTVQN